MSGLKENNIYPATIEGYASDGSGVARVDGGVVFVKNAIRGEEADVCIEHVGHNAAWAHIKTLKKSAEARITPDCSCYESCGGCQFRHMTYEEELAAKRQRVDDALARIGGLDLRVEKIWGAKTTDRYRNKIQLPVANGAIGYYQARSHKVVNVADCALQPERAEGCRLAVLDWMKKYKVPAYNEKKHTGLVRHLYLRSTSVGDVMVCIVINADGFPKETEVARALCEKFPNISGVLVNVNKKNTNVVLGEKYRTLCGKDTIEDTLCDKKFIISPSSFYQVNHDGAELLYRKAASLAALGEGQTLIDLYCGTGTIGISMADKDTRLIGVEIVESAVECARENARANGMSNAEFFAADASSLESILGERALTADVVVIDPPRKGTTPRLIEYLSRLSVGKIVYISCDPDTLARDCALFAEKGYELSTVYPVDMFPRTAHVESVVCLTRK